jgi:hypothetical protein
MMDRKLAAIAIPLSNRSNLTEDENISLRQLERYLSSYDRYLIIPESLEIEIAGFKEKRFQSRYFGSVAAHRKLLFSKDFYEAFFQSVSRLNDKDCKHIAIAMPEQSRKILPIRAKMYKVAWDRIARVFPELEIWLVDIENKKYQRTPWIYWLGQNI